MSAESPGPRRENLDGEREAKPKLDISFYVTDHSADSAETGDRESLQALYKDIRRDDIRSIRYDWRWNAVEPNEGTFEEPVLSRYATAAEVMHEVGLEEPTIILSSIPDWALELYKTNKESFFAEYQT